MIPIQEMKQKVCKALDERAEELKSIGNHIFMNPELGFKEFRTAEYICERIEQMGLSYRKGLAITGIKAYIDTGRPGPTVAVIGELDSVICPEHSSANKETGAAHTCGHHAQLVNMLGVGLGFLDSGILDELCGRIVLFATPAEEPFEADYRAKLKEEGKIKFTCGGKQELIRLGEFDDIDLALFVHIGSQNVIRVTSNAFISKRVIFSGKEAHAGNAPHLGINALNAATIAWTAINSLRETFIEEDYVRVHGIMPQGGKIAISVPAEVSMELIVRAKTIETTIAVNDKVNRALKAGAMAVGAKVEIIDTVGFLPMDPNEDMAKLFESNFETLLPNECFVKQIHFKGGFDMGDVGHIIPQVHPMLGGCSGNLHQRDFTIIDEQMVYVNPAKIIAMTIIDLLADNARKGSEIIKRFQPKLSKNEYVNLMEGLSKKSEFNYID